MDDADDLTTLKALLASKEKALQDLKEKTKAYVQKLQNDNAELLQREKENAKQAQVF